MQYKHDGTDYKKFTHVFTKKSCTGNNATYSRGIFWVNAESDAGKKIVLGVGSEEYTGATFPGGSKENKYPAMGVMEEFNKEGCWIEKMVFTKHMICALCVKCVESKEVKSLWLWDSVPS